MKHKIQLSPEFIAALRDLQDSIDKRVEDGTLPQYKVFVQNLFKDGDTAAIELHHACTGIAGEAGEILDLSKKVWVYDKPLNPGNLLEELGDLRFYYQAVLNMLDLTDEQIIAANMNKLAIRYSSGTYSNEQANARADKTGGRKFIGMEKAASNPPPDAVK